MAGGDVNADGKADLLFSAPSDDGPAGEDAGSVRLYYGPFDPIEGSISLDDSDTVIDGEDAGDWTGYAVTGVGDVNCDGVPDLALSGIMADETASATGAVYLFWGPTPGSDNFAWLNAGLTAVDADAVFYGDAAGDGAGNNVSTAGDIDGDGCDEFLVAAGANDGAGVDAGAVYLFYGSELLGGVLGSGDAEATFRGVAAGDNFGTGLAGGGDFTGDGIPDFVVGAPYYDGGAVDGGAVYIFSGATGWSGTVGANSATCRYRGYQAGAWAGFSVEIDFDFNGDGVDDLAVGAPSHDYIGLPNAGMVFLEYGGACAPGYNSLGMTDARIRGTTSDAWLGFTTATGDVDPGDGVYEDLFVGSPGPSTISGESAAYWIPGRSGLTGTVAAPANGVQVVGSRAELFAWSVAAGDFDGEDGDELLVGEPWDSSFFPKTGAAYAWWGSTLKSWENDGLGHSFADAEVQISGQAINGYAGWAVSSLGDLNQDGEDDIGIGAWGTSTGIGTAYVVLSSH